MVVVHGNKGFLFICYLCCTCQSRHQAPNIWELPLKFARFFSYSLVDIHHYEFA